MVKLSKSPIDESQTLVGVVDHDVVGLHISVHDALAVAEVKRFQNFVNVKPNIVVFEVLVELAEIDISRVNVLHDEGWGLSHGVSDDVNQVDDIDTPSQSLQNFDFSSNFGLFYWLQNLNDNPFVIKRINAFVDFRVFASSDLFDDFIVLLRSVSHKNKVKSISEFWSKSTNKNKLLTQT